MFSKFAKLNRSTRVLIVAAGSFAAGPTLGYACPMVERTGEEIVSTAGELWSGAFFYVTAGGDVDLSHCPFDNISPRGFVTEGPDFELALWETDGYSLTMRVEAECDSVLLVNTGTGNWFFDDDDGGNGNPEIILTRPSEGVYDIWVGTYGGDSCAADLVLETNGRPGV